MKKNIIVKLQLCFVALILMGTLINVVAQEEKPSSKGAVLKNKAPVSKEILKVKLPKPSETKLSNGLQVMILENHKLPTFTMQMYVLSGGFADPTDSIGAAQFTASLLREGTTTRNSKQIAEQVDALGASLNAAASLTSTSSTITSGGLVENFDQVMTLFSDVILHPTFPADEFNKLKSRQLQSLRVQRGQPNFLAGEMNAKVMFGTHPAGRFSLTAEQLNKLTPEVLQKFHAVHYKPNNAIFVIVGDVNPAQVTAKLEKYFAEWKSGDVTATAIPPVPNPGSSKVYLVDRPGSVQTNLVLSHPSIKRDDPDYYALFVLNQILGGNASARLFLNLREDKGYTYGAYSRFSALKYRGTVTAQTEVRSEVTGESVKELLYEFNRLRAEKVSDSDLENAKRTIVGGFALELESPQSILTDYLTAKIYGFPADYWDTYPQKISAVTADDLQRVAEKYLAADKLQIIAVGDASKVADALKKYGSLEIFDTNGKPKDMNAPAPTAKAEASTGLAGVWNLSLKTPDGNDASVKATINLTDGKITGALESPMGESKIVSGEVKGDDVKFTAEADMQGQKMQLLFSGKQSGNGLKGTIKIEGAPFPPLEVTGTKEK